MIIAFKILFFIFMLVLFIATLRSLCIFTGKLMRLEGGQIKHLLIFVLGFIIFIACFNFVSNNAEKLGFKVIEAQSSQN
tara:strand:+ start:66 stop:302 length:237 start_codon:yes stop_codon:yes gene_type:complete